MMLKRKQKWLGRILLLLIAELAMDISFLDPSLYAFVKKSSETKDKQKETSPEERTKVGGRAEAYYHFALARLLEENGDFTKAIDEYKKAIQQDPQSSYVYIELANAYLRHRRVRDAVQEVENAIRLNPDNLDAHKLLGTIYVSIIGNEDSNRNPASSEYLKKAIQEYETICRLDGSDTNSLLTLGKLYHYDGQTDKAIAS